MGPPDHDRVMTAYRSGVDAVVAIGGRLGSDDWQVPVTDRWDATDLAGHLLVVARWYHDWLDRSEAGATGRPFPADAMAERNDAGLAALDVDSGPERLARYAETARHYAERVPDVWDRPFAFPYGTVTVGTHAAAAASEWHIHAWDLGHAVGHEHRPADAALLYEGTGTALAAAPRTGLLPVRTTVAVARVMVRRAVRRADDPWRALLERSGRTPAG